MRHVPVFTAAELRCRQPVECDAVAIGQSVLMVGDYSSIGWGLGRKGGSTKMLSKEHRIRGFDALRAFAVTLVILSHVGIIAAAQSPLWKSFFSVFNANYGVKTFFVLSGFLITTLLAQEFDRSGSVNVPGFMLRRVFRILPLYFLVIAIVSVLAYLGMAENKPTARILSSILLYNFISRSDDVSYLSHLWSLAVEEQFYLFWPLVCLALMARRWLLSAFAIGIVCLCGLGKMQLAGSTFESTYYPERWTIPAIYPIMIGSFAALTIDPFRWLARSLPFLALSLFAISIPLIAWMTPFREIVDTCGIAGLIGWIYLNQSNFAVRALDWRPLAYIGQISYGLYVWQGIFTGNGPYREPSFLDIPLDPIKGALVTIPVAVLSYHLFEQPLIDIRKRISSRTSGALAEGADA
jgi:peptidoglycan/LPS O-acetylase OafA/YrhL